MPPGSALVPVPALVSYIAITIGVVNPHAQASRSYGIGLGAQCTRYMYIYVCVYQKAGYHTTKKLPKISKSMKINCISIFIK